METKLSNGQICALTLLNILGMGFVTIPKAAIMTAWRDGLTAIVTASAAAALYVLLLLKVRRGSISADRLTGCIFIIKTIVVTGLCLGIFADCAAAVGEGNLSKTAIAAAMVLLCLYCAAKGAVTRGRTAQLFIVPMLAALAFIFICAVKECDAGELLPLWSEDIKNTAYSALCCLMWFYPIEYVLLFCENASPERLSLTVLVSGLIAALAFALALMRFGAPQMSDMAYPVPEMMYSISLPSTFIERQEGLMLMLWVVGAFFTVSGGIFYSGKAAESILKGISPKITLSLCALAIFAVAMLQSESLTNFMLPAELGFMALIPFVMLRHRLKAVACVLLALTLCGCASEPEDRAFVTAAAIDGNCRVTLLTAEGSTASEDNKDEHKVFTGEGATPEQAVEDCGGKSGGRLFFGHTTLCIADKELLRNKSAVRDTVDFMLGTDVSRRVILLAADNAAELCKDGEVADFVREHYKAQQRQRPVELDKLCRALAENEDIFIPSIQKSGGSYIINGGALLADGQLKRELDSDEADCVAYLINDGAKGSVTVNDNGKTVTCGIKRKRVKITKDGIIIDITADTDNKHLDALCKAAARQKAERGFKILSSCGCDLLGIKRAEEKYHTKFDSIKITVK